MPPIAVLRAFHIAACVLVGGALVFELLLLGGAAARPDPLVRPRIEQWLRRLCALGVLVGLLSWAGWLGLVAIDMSGLPPAQALGPEVLGTVATRTTFGHVWLLRCVLLLVLLVFLLLPGSARRWRGMRVLAAVVAAALVGSLAWTGHAAAADTAHLAADAAHLLAAALWVGMLPPLWLVVHRAAREAHAGWLEFASTAARRFSGPGMAAVAVLAATGVFNGWSLVATAEDLVSTRYGLLLLAKVGCFALMVLVALMNRVLLTPRLADAADARADRVLALRRLRRNVLAEVLLGAAVLALVGVLGVTPPASHEHGPHQMRHVAGM